MNNIQLNGTILHRPAPFYNGKDIQFILRIKHPPYKFGRRPRTVDVPCRVFDPHPEQREILLSKKHRKKVRVEVAGRLEQIVSSTMVEPQNSRQFSNLEMIVNRRDLFLQQVR